MSSQAAAPYARIVAEIREQIETGSLAPGDRVPSTREITRRWGVAMATATKALTALRQEGLVRVVPGVGSVVALGRHATTAARPVRRRVTAEPTLTRERVVAAAVAVADLEGVGGVSMRRVAAELGIATMSLYRHVADKTDLLQQMTDAMFDELPLPDVRPDGWRAQLDLAATTLWATFRRHPWLAPALSITRPQASPAALAKTEWVLAALDGCGLDLSTMLTVHLTLVNYVRGTAINLELEAEAEAASGLDSEQWIGTQDAHLRAIVEAGDFPVFERLLAATYGFDLDALFAFGLQRLLDGLEVLIDA
jgi:AcrR family transcriptional regulator